MRERERERAIHWLKVSKQWMMGWSAHIKAQGHPKHL